jgi:hypothetical protein
MSKRDAVIRIVADDEVEDGRSVRTPLYLMDAVRFEDHQPHFVRAVDAAVRDARAAARDARDEMIGRAENAWRTPLDARRKPPDDDDDDDDDERERRSDDARSVADARAAATAAYDAMCARLRDAWRTPARDFAEPDLGTRPEDLLLMRRHLRTEPDDDAQARRDRAYRDYTTALSEAWKNPPGVTRAENAIVGAGPRSMVVEPTRGRTDPSSSTRIERQGEAWRGGR